MLFTTDGNFNCVKYIQLLKNNFISGFGEGEILHYYRSPCNRSLATQLSLIDESVIVLKDLPAQNPESNIFEQIWTEQEISSSQ